MSSLNLAGFREDLPRPWPAAFEVIATHALAPLTPDAHDLHVAIDLGNSEPISPARLNPSSRSSDTTTMRAVAQD